MNPPARFLTALFGDSPEGSYILIWTLPDKKSRWYQSAADAAAAVERLPVEQDIYFGVGLSPKSFGARRRCRPEQVAALTCLWADIDIAHDVHAKEKLPPDDYSAREVLSKLGPAPSILVQSGHGLQAYWLFKEPWLLVDGDERRKAIALCQRWAVACRLSAQDLGFDVDSVGDLSRVMRVPGTLNNKAADDPVEVQILTIDDSRQHDYALEDFEPYLDGIDVEFPKPESPKVSVRLDGNADPPFDKFTALLENEPKFRKSWERTRTDLQDDSPSGYDFSLALYAVSTDWTDKEIADLLVASRRRHGDPLKLREDYYALTLGKARQYAKSIAAGEELDQIAPGEAGDPETREERLQHLGNRLGVGITGVIIYLAEEPVFQLQTPKRDIILGDVSNLIDQRKFKMKVAAATRIVIRSFPPGQWQKIAQALLDVCEERQAGEEATLRGQVKSWILAFLDEHPPMNDLEEALEARWPYVQNEKVYVFATELRKWIRVTQGEKLSGRALGVHLRASGCESDSARFKQNGKYTTRAVWKLPGHLTSQVGSQ